MALHGKTQHQQRLKCLNASDSVTSESETGECPDKVFWRHLAKAARGQADEVSSVFANFQRADSIIGTQVLYASDLEASFTQADEGTRISPLEHIYELRDLIGVNAWDMATISQKSLLDHVSYPIPGTRCHWCPPVTL